MANSVESHDAYNAPSNNSQHRAPHDNSSLLVHITAIIVGILLSVFFVSTVNNMATISMRAESVTWGPYPVSVAAGRIETNIVHLQSLFEKMLVQPRTDSMIADTRTTYDSIMESLDTQFEAIEKANDLSLDAVDALVKSYEDFDDITDQLLVYYGDSSQPEELWQEYMSNTVMPAIEEILEDDSLILDSTSTQVKNAYEDAKQATTQTVMLSCMLMAAVAIMIVVYLVALRRKNIQEDKLMDALSKTLVQAQSASAAKSDFLSNMSHDIRTPLNAIIGLTIIANDNFDNQLRVKQCLNRIATSSQHLLGLINDVLDMNKIESGRVELAIDEISLSELANEIVNIVAPQIREKNLSCDIELDYIQHEVFIGDMLRLRQIFLNLVSNAIKYTNSGDSILISIREIKPDEEGFINLRNIKPNSELNTDEYDVANIEFKVADTGIGMKAEFLNYIFEPFERERNDFTNFTEGTGLGMAITKKLIDLMGGTIKVESEFGIGSTFTIVLPFFYDKATEILDLTGFDKLKVLLIGSSPKVLQSARAVMKELTVTEKSTTSGSKGISMAQQAAETGQDFDAILIGPTTGDMYGLDIAKSLHSVINRDKTQIFFVVYEDSSYHNNGYDKYIDAFVMKPLFKSRAYELLKRKCIDHTEDIVLKPVKQKPKYNARILLVEDNEINMEIAREILATYGVEIEEAADGLEAFAKITNNAEGYYDLIFMDCQMPHMNGIETTKALLDFENESDYKHTPIVAMTANAFDEDRKNALDAGMDDFLVKPIDIKELEATLGQYLQHKQS